MLRGRAAGRHGVLPHRKNSAKSGQYACFALSSSLLYQLSHLAVGGWWRPNHMAGCEHRDQDGQPTHRGQAPGYRRPHTRGNQEAEGKTGQKPLVIDEVRLQPRCAESSREDRARGGYSHDAEAPVAPISHQDKGNRKELHLQRPGHPKDRKVIGGGIRPKVTRFEEKRAGYARLASCDPVPSGRFGGDEEAAVPSSQATGNKLPGERCESFRPSGPWGGRSADHNPRQMRPYGTS